MRHPGLATAVRVTPQSSAAASAWEWAQAALLTANLGWTTLCLGGYLPKTQVVTGALTLALVLAHLAERFFSPPRDAQGVLGFHPAGWLMLAFPAYALVNVLWITPVRWLGWQDWFGWAQAIAIFWVGVNGIRARGPRLAVLGVLLILGVVAVVLACYQRFARPDWLMLGRAQALQFVGRASGPFGIPNSLGAFLLLLLPPCLALAFGRRAAPAGRALFAWLALVLGLGLVLTISRGGWISCALALTVWPLFSRRWPLRRRLGVAVGTLALLLLAGVTISSQLPKVRDRFVNLVRDSGELSRPVMWRAAWAIFREHPFVGAGAGSYNALFEKYRPEREQGEPRWAHNDYLNTLSDYGVTGFLLFFGAAGAIAWRARTRRPENHPAPARPMGMVLLDDRGLPVAFGIGLLAFGFQLFLDFHFKIPALALTCATVAALAVGQAWPVKARASAEAGGVAVRVTAGSCALAVLAVGGVWIIPRLRAEAVRYEHRREIDRMAQREASPREITAVAERARAGFSRALELDPGNSQAWADRAYSAAIIAAHEPSRHAELGREAEADARRALAKAAVVSEFWIRLGVALDLQKRWSPAGDAFTEALRLAPVSRPAWYFFASHLAQNRVTFPLARAAVATCLRLDPSNPEAEALRRYLSAGH